MIVEEISLPVAQVKCKLNILNLKVTSRESKYSDNHSTHKYDKHYNKFPVVVRLLYIFHALPTRGLI